LSAFRRHSDQEPKSHADSAVDVVFTVRVPVSTCTTKSTSSTDTAVWTCGGCM
jgi:hypothetical protein